jgi:hypothetical protein
MMPNGGPEDHTGPVVVSSIPPSGTTGVRRDCRIIIAFSKWITPASALKCASIQPPPAQGFTIRASGRKLEIVPRKPLADSATYHVVITSALQDFHGNALTNAWSLIFSTGRVLDSGSLAGCIIDSTSRPFQAIVGLYLTKRAENADTIVFGTPDYLTQSDSAGFFSFLNICNDTYRLVAFIDKNNNRRLDPGIEQAFSPLLRELTVSSRPDTVRLYPVETDTATSRILSVKALSAKIILCNWTAPLDSLRGYSDPTWSLERSDGKGRTLAVHNFYWIGNRTRLLLALDDTFSLTSYRLMCRFTRQNGVRTATIIDTIRCNGITTPDTIRPAFLSAAPTSNLPLAPRLRLIFSKPVTFPAQLVLSDSLNHATPLQTSEGFADTVLLTPESHLLPGMRYRLTLLRTSARDLTGNSLRPRDSASTDTAAAIIFSTIDPDSLATALRGCAPCLPGDPKRVWRFMPLSGAAPTISADSNGCFHFDSLPYGKGVIEYFTDINGNGKPDRGELFPFVAPEPFSVMPDTIEARARWEIDGVTFTKPCASCGPRAVKTDTGSATKKPRRSLLEK